MRPITRMILHGLASGQIKLTPKVIDTLKELSPGAETGSGSEPEEANTLEPRPSVHAKPLPPHARAKQLTFGDRSAMESQHLVFVSYVPGRWIRKLSCLLGCSWLLAAGLAQAASGKGAFEAANEAFSLGNYAEAARGYESVIQQSGFSAPVLFNLANAEQRDGKLGRAILHYEQAK